MSSGSRAHIGICMSRTVTAVGAPAPHGKFTMLLTEDGAQITGGFTRLDDPASVGAVKGHLRPGNRVELVVTLSNPYWLGSLNNFNAEITDSGNSLAGTTDFVLGSETRRSEVKGTRQ